MDKAQKSRCSFLPTMSCHRLLNQIVSKCRSIFLSLSPWVPRKRKRRQRVRSPQAGQINSTSQVVSLSMRFYSSHQPSKSNSIMIIELSHTKTQNCPCQHSHTDRSCHCRKSTSLGLADASIFALL